MREEERSASRYDVYQDSNRIAVFVTASEIIKEFLAGSIEEATELAIQSGFEVRLSTEWYYL